MPDLTLTTPTMWFIACATALVGGFVRGFAGFGGPAIMSLVLVQFYSPVSVLTKLVLIDFVVNLKLIPTTRGEVDWRRTSIIVAGSLMGLPLGLYALITLDAELTRKAIAAAAAGCSVVMLAGWRFRRIPPPWAYAVAGIASGVILGATFIALVMVVFLFASPVKATESRANTVYWAFATSLVLIVTSALLGALSLDDVWRSGLVGLVYLGGATLGARVFRLTAERRFRNVVLWLLVALSIVAVVRG